ncbi:hypothetical protein Avbf_09663 [Armadillidium vulgare]|nr:hypothetical protein Avbf_09663 [Armadillidium vulgare]
MSVTFLVRASSLGQGQRQGESADVCVYEAREAGRSLECVLSCSRCEERLRVYYNVFMVWLAIGAMLYKRKDKMLPFSAEECAHLNYSSANNSSIQELVNSTYSSYIEDNNVDNKNLTATENF